MWVNSMDRSLSTEPLTIARPPGAQPVEAGPLAMARWTEPVGMLLIKLGYVQGLGPMIGAPLLRYAGEKA